MENRAFYVLVNNYGYFLADSTSGMAKYPEMGKRFYTLEDAQNEVKKWGEPYHPVKYFIQVEKLFDC
jgi:hypothetical protein